MSLFHFHVMGVDQFVDVDGTNLDGVEAARREAVMIAREIILLPNGECPGLSVDKSVKIWVTESSASPAERIGDEAAAVLILEVRLLS